MGKGLKCRCESCLSPDYPYDFPPFVEPGVECPDCLRSAEACRCTCNTIGRAEDPFNGSLSIVSRQDDNFYVCRCENADDGMSVDSSVVTAVTFAWKADTLARLLATARRDCDDPEATTTWRFYSARAEPPTNLSCPVSSDDWTLLTREEEGSTVSEWVDPVFTSIEFTLLPPILVPAGEDTPDIYDCSQQPPPAFLLEITASCGKVILLCPRPSADTSPGCPDCIPGPCCVVEVDEDPMLTYATAPVDGFVDVFASINIDCGSGCLCSDGSLTVTIQLVGDSAGVGDAEVFGPDPATAAGSPYTFMSTRAALNGFGTPYTHARIHAEWTCNDETPPCPPGENCLGLPGCDNPSIDEFEVLIPLS